MLKLSSRFPNRILLRGDRITSAVMCIAECHTTRAGAGGGGGGGGGGTVVKWCCSLVRIAGECLYRNRKTTRTVGRGLDWRYVWSERVKIVNSVSLTPELKDYYDTCNVVRSTNDIIVSSVYAPPPSLSLSFYVYVYVCYVWHLNVSGKHEISLTRSIHNYASVSWYKYVHVWNDPLFTVINCYIRSYSPTCALNLWLNCNIHLIFYNTV